MVARYTVSDWARLPCDVDIASEWRDRNPILDENTLVIGLSPTGEDPETLAAIRLARDEGAWVLAVTEAPLSATGTEANGVLATRSGAGLEVAATKTFTSQAALMYLIALALAETRRGLPPEGARALRSELETVPGGSPPTFAGRGLWRRSPRSITTRSSSCTWGGTSGCRCA